jgi:hypothetical protein
VTTNDEIGDATIKVSVTDYDDNDDYDGDAGDDAGDAAIQRRSSSLNCKLQDDLLSH